MFDIQITRSISFLTYSIPMIDILRFSKNLVSGQTHCDCAKIFLGFVNIMLEKL